MGQDFSCASGALVAFEASGTNAGLGAAVRRSGVKVGLLSASLVLHAAVALILLRQPIEEFGGGGQLLDAVSVDIVASDVLESLSASSPSAPAVASANLDARTGAGNPTDEAAVAPSAATQQANAKPPQAEIELIQTPDGEATVAKPQPVKDLPERETPIAEAVAQREVEQQAPRESLSSGGAATRGASESQASEAAAGAAPGPMAEYGSRIWTLVSHNRRHPGRAKGRVVVAFALTTAGALRSATISTSSGNPIVDDAALAAVRKTQFPAPPPRAIERQLSYKIPFEFR